MITNIFSTLAAKVLGGVAVVLLIALGIQTMRASHYQSKAENCEIGRANDRKAYELSARQSEAKAIAQKQAVEAHYKQEAAKADDDYQTALARAQRASDAYAQRMRARIAGASSGTTSPAPGDSPESPDGPRADAVVVGRDDFDILVENSVRLEAAHQWAKTLNAGTIPSPAYGN